MAEIRAIGVRKGGNQPELFRIEAPRITKPNEVLLEMVNVGICGSDKDIIENSLVESPEGDDKLILGHEGLGKVVEKGDSVKSLKKGDYVAIIPRHGCGICEPCKTGRSDFCETGLYTASGQHNRHGFDSELYVEEEEYLVKVPKKLTKVAVLAEPFSIVEKAVEQIRCIQKRIPTYDFQKSKAVVFGMGSVGMAAIAILRANNIQTYALGRRDADDPKVELVKELGAEYVDMRNKDVNKLKEEIGTVEIVIEATGGTQLVIDLIELMSRNSIYVFLGIPKGAEELCFNIKGMINKIVRQNLLIVGSVNSQKPHFRMALKEMAKIQKSNNNILDRIITHRFTMQQYKEAFGQDKEGQVKAVIDFTKK